MRAKAELGETSKSQQRLALPPEVPERESIVTVSFAVVAFSIFVQGQTMTPLLRALGEIRNDPSGRLGD